MERRYELTRPELVTIQMEDGTASRGADQEWYATEWQRKAGCGPAAAAVLLSYLSMTRPEARALYPSGSLKQKDYTDLMEQVWGNMTPGKKGLTSIRMFTGGIRSFARERQCLLPTRELDIPRFRIARPSFSQCAAFLRTGLTADCPVAFLNFSGGEVENLEDWHWMPVIALEERCGGQAVCTILNHGREQEIDFRLWFHTTRTGGGLLYVPKENQP